MNILLAADGSKYTQRAARYLVENIGTLAKKPTIHVLHIRPEFPFPGTSTKQGIEKYQKEESEKALKPAEDILRKGGLEFKSTWVTGDAARCINDYVKKNGIDLIAMGSHGHGGLAGAVMGSFANKIMASCKTPALIVR
jgi:nucleotide-binding universal stress UspA family protein